MAAAAFATVADLEQRYRALSFEEQEKAAALLEDAAVLISREMRSAGIEIDAQDLQQASALRIVSCSIVKRALAGSTADSVTQATTNTGPFSHSCTYANPTAELYLTKQERRVLGVAKASGGCFSARPLRHGGINA